MVSFVDVSKISVMILTNMTHVISDVVSFQLKCVACVQQATANNITVILWHYWSVLLREYSKQKPLHIHVS